MIEAATTGRTTVRRIFNLQTAMHRKADAGTRGRSRQPGYHGERGGDVQQGTTARKMKTSRGVARLPTRGLASPLPSVLASRRPMSMLGVEARRRESPTAAPASLLAPPEPPWESWMWGSLRRCEDQPGGPALPLPLDKECPDVDLQNLPFPVRRFPSRAPAAGFGAIGFRAAPSRPVPRSRRHRGSTGLPAPRHRARRRGRPHTRGAGPAGQSVHDLRGHGLGWSLEDHEPRPHLDERLRGQ